jgi:excisionase family DNA binding protein
MCGEIRVGEQSREQFFTPNSLARYFNVTPRTVRQWLADGVLPSIPIEGVRRIDPADVDAYVDARRQRSTKGEP